MFVLLSLALAGVDPALPAGSGVGAPSGPTVVEEGALRSLDFVLEGGASRVLLGLEEGAAWSLEERGRTVELRLPGTSLPASLARDLPTQGFDSVVLGVQARADRAGALILVQLAREVDPLVAREGGQLVLAFEEEDGGEEPPEIAAVAVVEAPGSSGARVGVLIDERGRVRSSEALGVPPGSGAAPISLDLVDADVHDVLRLIAEVAGLNVVASDEVSGSVTVRLEQVPWDQALAAILRSEGLAATVDGGLLQVAPAGP